MTKYRITPIGVDLWEIQERFLGFFWRSIHNYDTNLSFTYARSIEQAEAIVVKLKQSDDAGKKREDQNRKFRRNNPTLYR